MVRCCLHYKYLPPPTPFSIQPFYPFYVLYVCPPLFEYFSKKLQSFVSYLLKLFYYFCFFLRFWINFPSSMFLKKHFFFHSRHQLHHFKKNLHNFLFLSNFFFTFDRISKQTKKKLKKKNNNNKKMNKQNYLLLHFRFFSFAKKVSDLFTRNRFRKFCIDNEQEGAALYNVP